MTTRKLIPMLFSTEMAKANVSNSKTETRRIVKPIYKQDPSECTYNGSIDKNNNTPYGKAGDIIWMRESFNCIQGYFTWEKNVYFYKAFAKPEAQAEIKWKPSIHMPLEACRYFAIIESITIERLHNITNEGAIKEGIKPIEGKNQAWPDFMNNNGSYATARGSYLSLWDKINGEGSAAQNPWVWVIKYKRIGAAELANYADDILQGYKPEKASKVWNSLHACISRLPLAVSDK